VSGSEDDAPVRGIKDLPFRPIGFVILFQG